jgi:hypothetical protein
MAKKIMTPVEDKQLGRGNKKYRQGDKIPEAMLEFFKAENLVEWTPPAVRLKKDMALKVGKNEYKAGDEIRPEDADKINPEFMEPVPNIKKEEEKNEIPVKKKIPVNENDFPAR